MGSLLSRVVIGAGVAAAVMLRGPVAGAQPAPPSPQDVAAASKLVDEAEAAVAAKDHDKAVDLYRRAYDLTQHPLMIFNIAQTYRLAEKLEQALQFYERYLQLDPGGSQAATAQVYLTEIKATLASRPPPPPPPSEPVEPRPPEPPRQEEPRRTDTPASPGRTLRITGLALGAVGIASIAFGGFYGLKMLDYESDTERATVDPMGLEDDGNAAAQKANIGLIVGGGLVIGGAVTYWLGHRKGREARTTALAPVVGPGFAGLAISGSLR